MRVPQHFHTKAALMICSSRASLPQVRAKNGEIRQNRWVSFSTCFVIVACEGKTSVVMSFSHIVISYLE